MNPTQLDESTEAHDRGARSGCWAAVRCVGATKHDPSESRTEHFGSEHAQIRHRCAAIVVSRPAGGAQRLAPGTGAHGLAICGQQPAASSQRLAACGLPAAVGRAAARRLRSAVRDPGLAAGAHGGESKALGRRDRVRLGISTHDLAPAISSDRIWKLGHRPGPAVDDRAREPRIRHRTDRFRRARVQRSESGS